MTSPERRPESEPQPTLPWTASAPEVAERDLTGTLLGDFQVERLLGKGGMGQIYLARQVSLNREVAIKVLRPDLLNNPTYLSRFESEAWAVARLNNPNIVHIYTLGSLDGIRFIAMEYVPGTNLREFLNRKGPPELMLALSIMKQAGLGIKAAAEVGLIHRDIKPENLLITKKGAVKIADFGLCRDMDSQGRLNLTQDGVAMGTPLYMSPEQAQGKTVDHRSDLYSLGVTFYHMLSGSPPFRGDSPLIVALKHVKDPPVDLRVHRPDLPPDLCKLVMKLLEKNPANRYQTAGEMLRDVAKIREQLQLATTLGTTAETGGGTSLSMVSAAVPPVPDPFAITKSGVNPAESSESTAEPEPLIPRARRLALAASIMIVVGGLVGWRNRGPDLLGGRAANPGGTNPGGTNPGGRPALWMSPEWRSIPKQVGPEAQYRHAQTKVPETEIEAAWLAVPGHFPSDFDWSAKAYVQLARVLFRRGDRARLDVFASELKKVERGRADQLAEVARVAAAVLNRDRETLINSFLARGGLTEAITDHALAELCLEITLEAKNPRYGKLETSVGNKLDQIQRRFATLTLSLSMQALRDLGDIP